MHRKSVKEAEPGGLGEVLASPAFARLVLHFALHGEEPEHVRALQRHCGLSMSSLHRELQRLERRGLVERVAEGPRVLYRAAQAHPGWKALRQLIRDFADPAEVVEEAIAGVEGIEAAFVFGSFARGDAREDSDVDVMVVGDRVAEARLGRGAAEASVLLGRPVEVRTYTREKLERQLGAGNAVLRRILAGPKRWVVGDEDRLGTVAA
ncbi:MAG TPA: nucleotidyltransferase domain-containing protein [Longimicrobium sp.]|jgi:predicted nucleotidyltransferase